MNENVKTSNARLTGIIYGVLSYSMWGVLPLYWKLLKQIPASEILAHRILWSFVFVGAILVITKRWDRFKNTLKDKKNLLLIFLCSVMIGINWFTYIWAVNSNHIIESSMGYYINPLIAVILGVTVLKERLNLYQYAALALAAAGVIIVTVQYGSIPWVAIILAISFALYGLFKKLVAAESLIGLALETAILVPASLVFLTFRQVKGIGAVGNVPAATLVILIFAGVVTATPLLCFAKAAKLVELATIGFLQYISPTLSLILGIFVYGEHFSKGYVISFGFIWAALVVFSISQASLAKNYRKNYKSIDNAEELI